MQFSPKSVIIVNYHKSQTRVLRRLVWQDWARWEGWGSVSGWTGWSWRPFPTSVIWDSLLGPHLSTLSHQYLKKQVTQIVYKLFAFIYFTFYISIYSWWKALNWLWQNPRCGWAMDSLCCSEQHPMSPKALSSHWATVTSSPSQWGPDWNQGPWQGLDAINTPSPSVPDCSQCSTELAFTLLYFFFLINCLKSGVGRHWNTQFAVSLSL